jgi:hypothetical protein
VINTINAQNLILPSGTEKVGQFEYQVGMNASPPTLEELNAMPVTYAGAHAGHVLDESSWRGRDSRGRDELPLVRGIFG